MINGNTEFHERSKSMKKIISTAAAIGIAVTSLPNVPKAEAAEKGYSFDSQTVMWTNNKIENVLAEDGIYKNAAEVNPNASKDSSGVQNPYKKPGELFNQWEYSEYVWTHFYPVGNGRMAGMIAGGIDKEVIQLNEDTCWDGSPYGTLKDENGNTITTMAQAYAAKTITAEDPTSGSVKDGWKYFRGANADGSPAAIGSSDAIVGDEEFRTKYPEFANKSISSQSLAVDNSKTQEAVQNRWQMERMVEATVLGSPQRQRAYKSFAEVYLDFGQDSSKASNYVKYLDMPTGTVTVEYDYDGGHYKRDNFISYPDQAAVTHIESDKELDFSAQLHTYHSEKAGYYSYEKLSDNEVKVHAAITNGNKDNNEPGTVNAVQFEARMYLDGSGAFTVSDDNTTVYVKGGNSANIYVVGATNYVDYLHLDNSKPESECERYMNNIKKRSYDEIRTRHVADFEDQFSKSEMSLENVNGADYSTTPTEERVRENIKDKSGFSEGASSKTSDANKKGVYSTYSKGDNQLAALEFNYGKYLLMSGSRDERKAASADEIDIPMSQPLNLTGKWNAAFSASWNGKYTININTEMNYWAAQPLNIGASEKALIDTFSDLAESGAITAANQYAVYNDRGDDTYQPGDPWVMHHNYDLWRGTQPIDNATAGLWPTGGVWLLDHAWQYYEFNHDKEYLAEVYPYMIGAAKFFTQFLVVDPVTGYLVTAASCSPEQGGVQPGPAMDTQLIRNLYDSVIEASEVLGKTDENAELINKMKSQLPSTYFAEEKGKLAPDIIDNNGLISEWARGDVTFDISEKSGGQWTVTNPFTGVESQVYDHAAGNNTGHRHCSHLWEVFPGTHLSAYSDDAHEQAVFEAYQKSVEAKGCGSGQGWGVAWRIGLNARALNADRASEMVEQLLTTRTSPNLFDQHPNFQIDGNYGAAAGMTEMVLQSHDNAIDLLPALPSNWKEGHFAGLKARGNVTVDCSWTDGKAESAKLTPSEDGTVTVRNADIANARVIDTAGNKIETTYNAQKNTLSFTGKANEGYSVLFTEGNGVSMTYSDGIVKLTSDTDRTAVLIQSIYDESGRFVSAKTYPVSLTNGVVTQRVEEKPGSVLTLWESIGSAKPLCDSITIPSGSIIPDKTDKPIATATPTPVPTEVPELGNTWISTDADSAKKTGDALMNGLTLVFDVSSSGKAAVTIDGKSFGYYISSSDNGKWSGGAAIGTALKYTAPSDGKFTVYITSLGANKELCITKADVSDNKINAAGESAYYKNETGEAENKSLSLDVKKGETYYTYVAGSKGRFVGAELVPAGGSETAEPTAPAETTKPAETTEPTETTEPVETATPTDAPSEAAAYIGETAYSSVREAVNAVNANPPSDEESRVYIDIMPGVHREQVVVKAPYVTLRRKPGTEGETKLTWYYGLGTLYDSCNENGYYDESAIGDGKAYGPRDWGPSLKVDKSAAAFTAENLVLENSYNRYYTEEELTDITSVDPDTNNSMFHRLEWIQTQKKNGVSDDEINAFLQTRDNITFEGVTSSPRERCAALHCSADKAQFINCEIISTQDTIGINSGRMYFKNCKLGGTTDFICGSAQAVFDGCELFSNAGSNGESATITAPSNPSESLGYLFYNCKVTGTSKAGQGTMGRPWGDDVAAAYINTVINSVNGKLLINDKGWTSMSGHQPEDARFREYGSTKADGSAVDTSKRVEGSMLNEWTMLRYNPYVYTSGNDGWDPANMSETYAAVNDVIDSTNIDTSDGSAMEISLPQAPEGYEFSWESTSEFAVVNDEGTKISLIRPANGENAINAEVKLYARKADDRNIGAEKTIGFEIAPTTDTENTFTIAGKAVINPAPETEQIITVTVKKGNAVIKSEDVVFAPGDTEQAYSMENIPIGSYIVEAQTANEEYNILTEAEEISGEKGETKEYNVEIKKMTSISVTNSDFDTVLPTVNAESGFSAGVYTASGSETANLGAGNKVYRLTKAEGSSVSASTGVSFKLNDMLPQGATLANTKSFKFSFDFLMESTAYMPSDYSYFDLASSTANAGKDAADTTRYVRWGVHKGWGQFNFMRTDNTRVNGDNTQFDKNSVMANKWYRMIADVNLENKTIYVTAMDRDNDTILNKKSFVIAEPASDGTSAQFPSDAGTDELYFNIYMSKKDTTNKMEYYFDNITLEYSDFE